MSPTFRTTLRLDLGSPAGAQAAVLLRQLHAERGLSYSALIVPAVNAYYGKATADESLRETIRSIVREELAAAHPTVKVGKVNTDENLQLAMARKIDAIPALLLFKNGQTLGKKAFGLAVMRSDAVRLSPLLLLVRTLLGKYTLELMVPVLVIFLFFFGGIGILGPGILCGLALVQVLLLAFTQNHTPLHDLIAHTVVVDYASQMIFDSPEALLRAKEEYHASLARSERY